MPDFRFPASDFFIHAKYEIEQEIYIRTSSVGFVGL